MTRGDRARRGPAQPRSPGPRRIDLLQFHWWIFEHPAYLDAMAELARLRAEGKIGHLGVTNFDTDHLRVLVKHGIPIATNQVCFSLLDRRAAGDMTASAWPRHQASRLRHAGRRIPFRALARRASRRRRDIADWSKMKYQRFIDAIGGWEALQAILAAADGRAQAWRLDRQCRDPLGPRSARSRRRHRRRPARRARASRRTICASSPSISTTTTERDRSGAGALDARSPAIAATNIGGRPISRPRGISATICAISQGLQARPCRAGRAAGASIPAASGSRRRLQPRDPLGDAFWSAAPPRPTAGRGRLPRRRRGPGRLHPRQDRRQPARSAAPSTTSSARASICGRRAVGGRLARPWPLFRPCPPREHPGRASARRRLRGGDRGRGGGGRRLKRPRPYFPVHFP